MDLTQLEGKTVKSVEEKEQDGFGSDGWFKYLIITFTDGTIFKIHYEDAYGDVDIEIDKPSLNMETDDCPRCKKGTMYVDIIEYNNTPIGKPCYVFDGYKCDKCGYKTREVE